MSGGGKNAASREATQARKAEEARQKRIRQGTNAINATFGGGTVGTGALGEDAVFDPNAKYYLADGTEWKPSGQGGLPGTLLGRNAKKEFEEALKNGLFSGIEQRTGFNDDFFSGLSQSFIDYARPQLDDQFGKAREQLTFALARNGTLDSSMRGEQNADLQRDYDTNLQDITDKGRQYATDARTNVERARADLIGMLQATGDAAGATNAALSRASILSQPPAYSPLGQLFTDVTSGLATQAAFERAEALGGYPRGSVARYNTGLFSPRPGAVKVS